MKGLFLHFCDLVRIVPEPTDGKPWRLSSPLGYRCGDGLTTIVPEGFRTDFASVPWFCRRMFPQDGPWTYAAIVHDYYCDIRPPHVSSKRAAAIFLEAMEALDVHAFQRNCMYRAVLWFGPQWK